MRYLLVGTLLFLAVLKGSDGVSQFSEGEYLYYDLSDDLGVRLVLNKADTTESFLNGRVLTYKFKNDTLSVEYQNEDGIYVEGQYWITFHVFQRVGKVMDPDTGEFILAINNYKYPLKTGKWLYYDEHEALMKVETWENGFLKSVKAPE
ncbi:MAG: hypothetical protein LC664_13395 [Flavobacteriales bacterium]|nr:hypothetical protein [Flavobacteriales bacterium]